MNRYPGSGIIGLWLVGIAFCVICILCLAVFGLLSFFAMPFWVKIVCSLLPFPVLIGLWWFW